MRRTIYCAVFALIVSNEVVFSQTRITPRPRLRVIAVHRFHPPCFFPSVVQAPYPYPVPYSTGYYVQDFVAPSPAYVFVGNSSPARPQLVFKDGTTYTVSDYWRVDDQLHFITIEEGGTKSVPHSVPFENLDVQRTKDAAAAQGFRYVIRDEPIQQWLQHRAQHGPRRTGTTGKS
jgi:hypothetical protein